LRKAERENAAWLIRVTRLCTVLRKGGVVRLCDEASKQSTIYSAVTCTKNRRKASNVNLYELLLLFLLRLTRFLAKLQSESGVKYPSN
jgi:hypothetical protein